jgi:protein-S-isoprenylcysteine O-methyltransferase Ste14
MSSESGAAPAKAPADTSSALTATLVKYCVVALLVASILRFVSGRSDWSRAWFFVGFIFLTQAASGLWLMRVQPGMMAERSRMREGTKTWDKVLVPLFVFVGPIAMWVMAALDVRTHWPPPVPLEWSIAAFAVLAAASAITIWAMRTNRFFAATVRIQSDRGQTVVSTGPYAIVRHPGYIGAVLFTLATPVVLGSWSALIPAVLTGLVLVLRTFLEDRTLQAELDGYREYTTRVRFRLIPGIW